MKKLALIVLMFVMSPTFAAGLFVIGEPLKHWQTGYLDIYHINIGSGNTTFMILPDGTTLLYDLGDVSPTNKKFSPFKEDTLLNINNKMGYESVSDFISAASPHPDLLNYAIISHYHFDHMGQFDINRQTQTQGHYKLSGITGLAEKIHIQKLIDRSYPVYNQHGDFPSDINSYLSSQNNYAKTTALTLQNYQAFINYQKKQQNLQVERFKVGSNSQIQLLYGKDPKFQIRNIIGNGDVWTGKNQDSYHFIKAATPPNPFEKHENDLSCGFRIDYGLFRYFTGGDISGRELSGKDLATSAEAVAAPVIGKVDVATMNHHGFDDAESDVWVKTLRPLVWVQQNWSPTQTSLPMLLRVTDKRNYDYPTNLFSLNHFKLNDWLIPALGDQDNHNMINHYYKNSEGHVLIRVMPGGKQFWVVILANDITHPIVKAFYGPYQSMDK